MWLESLPESILDQKYRIERQLGEGAMGAVYKATHVGTTRPVALKVIVPQLADNQEFGQRFKREAEAAGRLNHPNVVNVTDFGVTQVKGRELAYLVMEYLEGQSLADYLKENPRPPLPFLLDVMEQTGLALDASHAAGIVHRDLKPSNIWLQPNHRGGYNVKVLDFGIAKVTNPTQADLAIDAAAIATMVMAPGGPDSSLTFAMADFASPSNLKTSAGTLLGTPAYMAPEQCASLEVDRMADVYSLAAIAYEMLCGRLPFIAANLRELIRQQIQTVPVSPREYDPTAPEALARVILSGLEKDPAQRPPTAGTFAARLQAACDAETAVIRKSKDAFHSNLRTFFPVLLVCMSVVAVAGMIPLRLAAIGAARAKLAPNVLLAVAMDCGFALLMVFAFQLFKAACTFLLLQTPGKGKGQARPGPVAALRAMAKRFGGLLGTQLLSAIDLRPSSWWANILWPVVMVTEGRSGKDAIARSRQLCEAVPVAAKNLAVRQYGPAMLCPLLFPTLMAAFDSTGGALHNFFRGLVGGSAMGWFFFLYPMILGILFVNFASAFLFLYWSAVRWRNEDVEMAMPAASRDLIRKSASNGLRPVSRAWLAFPLVMLTIVVARSSLSAPALAMDDASSDGRRTALLKLLDGGLGVEQITSEHETALFDAVRGGDETLVTELIKRGAQVNARNFGGSTPLLEAAAFGRNGLAQILLDRGAAVDAADREGRTSLMRAAMRGNVALARLLLARSAKTTPVDTFGKTAAAYAREEGYQDLAALLSQGLR